MENAVIETVAVDDIGPEIERVIAQADHAELIATVEPLIHKDELAEKFYGPLSVAFRKAGDVVRANRTARLAIDRFGATDGRLRSLGDTAMGVKDWPMAIGIFTELRLRFPNVAQGYYRAAQSFLALGIWREAEDLCAKGLETIDEPNIKLMSLYAKIAVRQKNWQEARERWSVIALAFPYDLDAPRGYVTAEKKLGGLEQPSPKASWFSWFGSTVQNDISIDHIVSKYQKVFASGRHSKKHSGGLRFMEKAKDDERLADILSGGERLEQLPEDGTPIRVGFYFPTVTQSDNVLPLYELMHADDRFDPFILCSRNNNKMSDDSYKYFSKRFPKQEGHRVIDGGSHVFRNTSLYELSPHFVFYHTPYTEGANFPYYLKSSFVSRHSRVCHVNYGFFALTMGAEAEHILANPHVDAAKLVFCENKQSEVNYLRYYPKEKLRVTGYPKFDEYRRFRQKGSFEELFGSGELMDVVWTPHWQFDEDPTGGTHTSNFLTLYPSIMKLAERDDIALHVRPHPLVRGRLQSLGIMTYAEYDNLLAKFEKRGAVVHPANSGASYIDVLAKSAVLISDFSSLVPEFAITKRPIIFCPTEQVWNNGVWIGELGKSFLEKCCYLAWDENSIVDHLDKIVKERKHPKYADMESFFRENEFYPQGSACNRVLDEIVRFAEAESGI